MEEKKKLLKGNNDQDANSPLEECGAKAIKRVPLSGVWGGLHSTQSGKRLNESDNKEKKFQPNARKTRQNDVIFSRQKFPTFCTEFAPNPHKAAGAPGEIASTKCEEESFLQSCETASQFNFI